MGQLPDVVDVMVEEAMTLNHFNTPTNNPNHEMDKVDMETNLTAEGLSIQGFEFELLMSFEVSIFPSKFHPKL